MDCPRCGAKMIGGICNECGFPITAKRRHVINYVKYWQM